MSSTHFDGRPVATAIARAAALAALGAHALPALAQNGAASPEPGLQTVVVTAQKAEAAGPKRTSFPSMLPRG